MNIKGQAHSLTFVEGYSSDSTFSNFFSLDKKGFIRKDEGVLQSQTAANPRHQEEDKKDKN